jgi:hypothetical protein
MVEIPERSGGLFGARLYSFRSKQVFRLFKQPQHGMILEVS